LRLLDSYWTQALPLGEKLGRFAQEYWNGLRPDYWFAPDNGRDLIRHQMKGYAQLPVYLLPFLLGGLFIVLRRLRSAPSAAPQRTLLIALLIAPIGGVLVAANVLRDLVFVVPAALLSAIGLIAVLEHLAQRVRYPQLALGTIALLVTLNLFMLYDATTNGSTWYDNFGLTGLQYGGPQVFAEAKRQIEADPQRKVWIAATWLNGPEALKAFFAPTEPRIQLFDLNAVLHERYDIETLTLVLNRDDFQRVTNSGKFTIRAIDSTLPYPDGTPGFYFTHLAYSPRADALFAAENEARTKLLSETIEWQGQPVLIAHSRLDLGSIGLLFDGDPATLVRTQDVNPAVFDLTFATPISMTGIAITTGSMDIELAVEVRSGNNEPPRRYAHSYTDLSPDPTVELVFGESLTVKSLHLEIKNPNVAAYNNVHLREIEIH
jgi:hypothetical protein